MKTMIMCVGNRDGGDDAIGAYVYDALKSEKTDDFNIIDCGTIPENFTSLVKMNRPEKLIIIDAVNMKLNPGEIRIVPKEKIAKMHTSTHNLPLHVLISYLEPYVKKIVFVGIQPEKFSGKLSNDVRKAGENLITKLRKGRTDDFRVIS